MMEKKREKRTSKTLPTPHLLSIMICKIRELLTKPWPVIIHNYQKSSKEGACRVHTDFGTSLEEGGEVYKYIRRSRGGVPP